MSETTTDAAHEDAKQAPPSGDAEKGHDSAAHGHDGHGADGHGEHYPADKYPYVAHHFDSPQQQFEAGKMGIWLFLVTEVLFFAGLFCAYTVYRSQHPEVFAYAHYYLDTKMGAINTVVLILSSLTAAWAVRAAQLGNKRALVFNIVVTIACAFTFMCVKYVEYSHKVHDGLLPGRHFHPKEEVWEEDHFKHKHPEAAAAFERLTKQLEEKRAEAAAEKAKAARAQAAAKPKATAIAAAAPTTATADAGAEATTEAIAAPEAATTGAGTPEPAAAAAAAATPEPAAATVAKTAPAYDEQVYLASLIRKLKPEEAKPLVDAGILRNPSKGKLELSRPGRVHIFFGIYFFMTGLHGIHVLAGIGVWIWLLVRAIKGQFGPKYFGPIDFAALYWHLVDLIWIYLFPLLYLIH